VWEVARAEKVQGKERGAGAKYRGANWERGAEKVAKAGTLEIGGNTIKKVPTCSTLCKTENCHQFASLALELPQGDE
jgi:hypothetical protein